MNIHKEILIKTVEERRKSLKLSIKDLTDTVNISPETYWRFISGKTELGLGTFCKLLVVLDIDVLLYRRLDND